jgi:Ca2+-binding EF-hand superfamily protein
MFDWKRWALTLVFAMSLVGFALGQVAKKQAEQFRELFFELDANHDNAIERDEVPASGRPAFERLLKRGDDNHNGKLEAEEYRALLVALRTFTEQAKKQAVTRFKSMDKDGDGKVSRDEFTGPKPRFDVLDRDGDGLVTEQEFLSGAQVKAAGKVPAKKKASSDKKDDDVKKAE